MTVEWRSKTENPVEIRRPSTPTYGSLWLTHDPRLRQPFLAKEPLCGNQSTNLSLVIAVFRFPSCFVVLLFYFCLTKEVVIDNKN
jgi:hypothetical protein